eukprot:TRINITY_DN10214_c0_g2_i1.p1 TRINITY_DN10214_c0_g2~~TRINITY_DN10214_c0_g2_i1.p1  ORF type:complete len:923 (+),score=248.25 TRINITY_DN10214_c0_g2_i1:91-2769(+)
MGRTTYRFEGRITTVQSQVFRRGMQYVLHWKRGGNNGTSAPVEMGQDGTLQFREDLVFTTNLEKDKSGMWKAKNLTLILGEPQPKGKLKEVGRTEIQISKFMQGAEDHAFADVKGFVHNFRILGEHASCFLDAIMHPDGYVPAGLVLPEAPPSAPYSGGATENTSVAAPSASVAAAQGSSSSQEEVTRLQQMMTENEMQFAMQLSQLESQLEEARNSQTTVTQLTEENRVLTQERDQLRQELEETKTELNRLRAGGGSEAKDWPPATSWEADFSVPPTGPSSTTNANFSTPAFEPEFAVGFDQPTDASKASQQPSLFPQASPTASSQPRSEQQPSLFPEPDFLQASPTANSQGPFDSSPPAFGAFDAPFDPPAPAVATADQPPLFPMPTDEQPSSSAPPLFGAAPAQASPTGVVQSTFDQPAFPNEQRSAVGGPSFADPAVQEPVAQSAPPSFGFPATAPAAQEQPPVFDGPPAFPTTTPAEQTAFDSPIFPTESNTPAFPSEQAAFDAPPVAAAEQAAFDAPPVFPMETPFPVSEQPEQQAAFGAPPAFPTEQAAPSFPPTEQPPPFSAPAEPSPTSAEQPPAFDVPSFPSEDFGSPSPPGPAPLGMQDIAFDVVTFVAAETVDVGTHRMWAEGGVEEAWMRGSCQVGGTLLANGVLDVKATQLTALPISDGIAYGHVQLTLSAVQAVDSLESRIMQAGAKNCVLQPDSAIMVPIEYQLTAQPPRELAAGGSVVMEFKTRLTAPTAMRLRLDMRYKREDGSDNQVALFVPLHCMQWCVPVFEGMPTDEATFDSLFNSLQTVPSEVSSFADNSLVLPENIAVIVKNCLKCDVLSSVEDDMSTVLASTTYAGMRALTKLIIDTNAKTVTSAAAADNAQLAGTIRFMILSFIIP